MCGIVGALALEGDLSPEDRHRVMQGLRDTQHRGPDHRAVFDDPTISFGYNRLAIRGLSGASNQPLRLGASVAFGNGEVYAPVGDVNESDLAPLARRIAAADAWDFAEFDADFAIAVWDPSRRILKLARDKAGVKPLYYAQTGQQLLIFASEIKALLPFLDRPKVCPHTARDYLYFGYPTADRTFFADVRAIPPGGMMICRNGGVTMSQGTDSAHMAAADLPELIAQSVRRRMISDVGVGYHLSGGLDSTLVVSLAQQFTQRPLNTFCGYYGEDDFDKRRAGSLADQLELTHHEVWVDRTLPPHALMKTLDAPPMSLGALMPFHIAKAARAQGLKVMLAGQGSDELFLGYSRFRKVTSDMNVEDLLPYMANASRRLWDQFFTAPGLQFDATTASIASETPAAADARETAFNFYFTTFLQELLKIEDHCHMAASVENRVPFLGASVITWSRSQKMDNLFSFQPPKRAVRQCHRRFKTNVEFSGRKQNSNGSTEAYLRSNLNALLSDLEAGADLIQGLDIVGVRDAIMSVAHSSDVESGSDMLLRIAFLSGFARMNEASIDLRQAAN